MVTLSLFSQDALKRQTGKAHEGEAYYCICLLTASQCQAHTAGAVKLIGGKKKWRESGDWLYPSRRGTVHANV